MKGKALSFGVGLMVAVMAAMQGLAQEAAQTPGRGGPVMGGPIGRASAALAGAANKAVVTVATNATVVAELGLSEAQVALLTAGLDAEKVQQALAAQRLAEMVAEVLTDSQIATNLNLTAAQKLLIKQKMTADLVRKAFTPQQIDELSLAAGAAGAGGMARAAMDAMRQRMMQYDKDGDGQLSEEERRAAFQDLGSRWRGAQGGAQGAQTPQKQGDAGGARGARGGNQWRAAPNP